MVDRIRTGDVGDARDAHVVGRAVEAPAGNILDTALAGQYVGGISRPQYFHRKRVRLDRPLYREIEQAVALALEIGIDGGVNFDYFKVDDPGGYISDRPVLAAQIGVKVEKEFNNIISAGSGLIFKTYRECNGSNPTPFSLSK